MDITLATPALLFPTVSLLLLAYTNRFLALASLIRALHANYKSEPDELIIQQIQHLRHRVILVRNMQAAGVASIFLCVVCMFLLFAGYTVAGHAVFGLGLVFLMISLAVSLREIQISVDALNLHLSDLESQNQKSSPVIEPQN
jgi:hypothetical protein